MEKVRLEYQYEGAVARVTLDDGKGNVMDHIMMEEIQELLLEFRQQNGLKLITWEGAGKHFSFGASVEEHQQEFAAAMLAQFHELFYMIRDLGVPTLAKVSGNCLGGGFELALNANFMFTDRSAKMGLPEITLGVFPPPASVMLPLKIGYGKAEELLITGRLFDGDEGKEMGLVTHVFDDKKELDEGVDGWIQEYILPRSASSLRFAVKAARVKFNHIMGNFLPQLENMYVSKLMATHDANEGIHSFLEKRKPAWENC